MEQAISEFFAQRKEAWLKKTLKTSMNDDDVRETTLVCEQMFSLQEWLPNAAKRAGQISISTHPCTFSHPSARKNKNGYVSSVIATSRQDNDGFLRSGNVSVAADALGNAAALDVYKFLTLVLSDGETLLTHLQNNTALAKSVLTVANPLPEQAYDALREGFLAMVKQDENMITSSKIKQIYFPIQGNEYHQLSILTPSGIVFDLRKRLDNMRFGDEIKECRERRKNHQAGEPFKEIYDLTTIGYGGTKPQNISVLNNANGGKAHLFLSMPPTLETRKVNFPTKDFFTQNMYYGQSTASFKQLHSFYLQCKNNMNERARRDALYQDVIDDIIENMHQVRSVASEQYIASHSLLNVSQRVWLHVTPEPENADWLDDILKHVTQFIFHGYEKMLDKRAIKLGDAEYQHIEKIVDANKEVLR